MLRSMGITPVASTSAPATPGSASGANWVSGTSMSAEPDVVGRQMHRQFALFVPSRVLVVPALVAV